jgi:hypothetical protein
MNETISDYLIPLLLSTCLVILIKRIFTRGKTSEQVKDDLAEISKKGLLDFIKHRHDKLGGIVEFYMGPSNLIVSINDPVLLRPTVKLGSRPKPLFEFISPLIGKDNLQIFNAERAFKFRKLISSSLGPQGKYELNKSLINGFLLLAKGKMKRL